MKFILSSHFNIANINQKKKYMYNYIPPNNQKCKFNYKKINFRYNPYNIDLIT